MTCCLCIHLDFIYIRVPHLTSQLNSPQQTQQSEAGVLPRVASFCSLLAFCGGSPVCSPLLQHGADLQERRVCDDMYGCAAVYVNHCFSCCATHHITPILIPLCSRPLQHQMVSTGLGNGLRRQHRQHTWAWCGGTRRWCSFYHIPARRSGINPGFNCLHCRIKFTV
jgi:hypothetical protein